MRRKILLSLFIVCILAGCGKSTSNKENTSENTKKNKNEYVCTKKGIEDSSGGKSWKKDITHTAKLDDDGKLTYYSTKDENTYESKADCEYWCDIKVKWNDEINAKNYTGGHRETTCKCENNILIEEYVYDDIANLAPILRSDIRQLKSDNTFDLDTWLDKRKNNGYNCD